MVDRPIKKSDREAAPNDQSGEKRNVPAPIKKADRTDGGPSEKGSQDRDGGKGRGKGRGKGKGRDKDDAKKAPINPALMRGPKPTKKVEPEEPAEEEVTAEATTEGTENAEGATEEATTETTPEEAAADPVTETESA